MKQLCKDPADRGIISEFLGKNKMRAVELSRRLGTSTSTMSEWLHTGPQYPKMARYALRSLQMELDNKKQELAK